MPRAKGQTSARRQVRPGRVPSDSADSLSDSVSTSSLESGVSSSVYSQSSDTSANSDGRMDDDFAQLGWHHRLHLEHGVRQQFVPMTADQLAMVTENVADRLGHARAESTKAAYASVVGGFTSWQTCNRDSLLETSLGHRLIMYVEYKMAVVVPPGRKTLQLSSALKYVKMFKTFFDSRCHQLTSAEVLMMDDYQAALRRGGALISAKAEGLTAQDLIKALRLQRVPRLMRAGIHLAWITASRCSDLQAIRVRDLVVHDAHGHVWDITFPHTKASNTAITDRSVLPAELEADLNHVIEGLGADDMPFREFTAAKVSKILRRVDRKYSGHSIKRGAIIAMVIAGISLERVRVKAKHKNMTQLHDYIPAGLIAEVLGSMNCSETLVQAVWAHLRQGEVLYA